MQVLKHFISLFLIFMVAISFSQTKPRLEKIPIRNTEEVPPLISLESSDLNTLLFNEISKETHWKAMINANAMTIGIVDLYDLNDIKYAGINDNFMMYSASLPKIAILLAAMDAIENGELEETPAVTKDMKLMISKSNNQASTRMIDRLGYLKIESVLRRKQHKFYDETTGGGLWVGKRYAAGGKRHPEPMKGLSHAATTMQVCSFYYQLVMGNLISYERSAQMLDIMVKPALHHKFVNTLEKIAPKANLYRKSGSWKNFHADSILVWGPKRRYIAVALIDDIYGEQIIRNLVKPIEKVLKAAREL